MKLKFGKLVLMWADPCELQTCDYYTHYLRQGPPTLPHAAFHLRMKEYLRWQDILERMMAKNGGEHPVIESLVERLEKEVRA